MKNQTLINRYAEGLVLALADDADYARVEGELKGLCRLFDENKDLQKALASPLLSSGRKAEIVGDVLDKLAISDKTRRFVLLLMEHSRLELLTEILGYLPSAWNVRKGIVTYEVTSAVPLSETHKKRLAAELERLERSPVRLTFELDASVLGGLSVRKGHLVYDASLKGSLNRLREQILEG